MGHKTYISFKAEDIAYKTEIQTWSHMDYVDKSLNVPINSTDPDYVLRRIRSEYLSDSTVTIFLIGAYSAERLGLVEQYYIKKELQASLYDTAGNTKNGILGIVLPAMQSSVFGGDYDCTTCGATHNLVQMNGDIAISEFAYNFYIPHNKCAWTEEERYCVLASWADFKSDPDRWIEAAFQKRLAPIANHTRVRP